MPRYAQLVMGPAGSGKSTYCKTIHQHCETVRRTVHVVNLDPAAEHFTYSVLADIRDLISVDDAMDDEALRFGPNGGLLFCMEYFAQNFQWLGEAIDDMEDDYILFDCPGQIELYTHVPVMRKLVDQLQQWNFRVCGVFLVDAQFLLDTSKYVSGVLAALSAMVNLEIPHVSVMSKLDLLNKGARQRLEQFLEPDVFALMSDDEDDKPLTSTSSSAAARKFKRLNHALANVIDDYSLVRFLPLDVSDEESISDLLLQVDLAIQYGEDLEPKEPQDMAQDDCDDDNDGDT